MVKRRTTSILEEIINIDVFKDKEHLIESKAQHIIAGVSNLVSLISDTYDEDTANDLIKRLHNAIKTHDPKKFERGIRKIHEDRRHTLAKKTKINIREARQGKKNTKK